MEQGGFFSKWRRKHKPPDQCAQAQETTTSSHAMDLYDMFALFIILSVGLFIAFVVLAVEVIVKKATKPRRVSRSDSNTILTVCRRMSSELTNLWNALLSFMKPAPLKRNTVSTENK